MAINFFSVEGEIVNPDKLVIAKAKELIKLIKPGKLPYVKLIECRRPTDQSFETIIIELEVERPQKVVNDIHRIERLSVSFFHDDQTYPEVLALREDFPIVPHRNLREKEFPISLCLYDEPYSEVKLDWEPLGFIERIRQWLALTAKGILHAEDQPLEPLFFWSLKNHLVIPYDLFPNAERMTESLLIKKVKQWTDDITLIAIAEQNDTESDTFGIATVFQCPPQTHGVINHHPSNFSQLCEITSKTGFDLINELRNRLKYLLMTDQLKKYAGKRLVLIISFPKKRTTEGEIEISDIWGFSFDDQIGTIGTDLGIWEVREGYISPLIKHENSKNGGKLRLTLLSPVYSFSREHAAQLNGVSARSNEKIAAIGLGALGSQIFINLIRAGFGEWILIDYDILLPHNLARHALPGTTVGLPKAVALALMANLTIDGDPISKYILENVLNPKYNPEELKKAFTEADIILDTSASIAVARNLSHESDLQARCISVFFTPSGKDLVILAEPPGRDIRLDLLEMQYYRYLINNDVLSDHLHFNSGVVRYANSCRDISSTISQDMVSLHASIASANIKRIINDKLPCISIWRADADSLSVQQYFIKPGQAIDFKVGEWKLMTDELLIKKIYALRKVKLPNETGGVLIGAYDMQRKIIYVADTIPSPPDSKEWPTVYIRGSKGLRLELNRIKNITLDRLTYVGEWHSHPTGSGCKPSQDDRKAFSWLKEIIDIEGLPALMLIMGDRKRFEFFLGQMM